MHLPALWRPAFWERGATMVNEELVIARSCVADSRALRAPCC